MFGALGIVPVSMFAFVLISMSEEAWIHLQIMYFLGVAITVAFLPLSAIFGTMVLFKIDFRSRLAMACCSAVAFLLASLALTELVLELSKYPKLPPGVINRISYFVVASFIHILARAAMAIAAATLHRMGVLRPAATANIPA